MELLWSEHYEARDELTAVLQCFLGIMIQHGWEEKVKASNVALWHAT